jgi:hypothetical protein
MTLSLLFVAWLPDKNVCHWVFQALSKPQIIGTSENRNLPCSTNRVEYNIRRLKTQIYRMTPNHLQSWLFSGKWAKIRLAQSHFGAFVNLGKNPPKWD